MTTNLSQLPDNLPRPIDDGRANHLHGARLPNLTLPSTAGTLVNLSALAGRWVIYIYPMTGRPGVDLPNTWDIIPGARGCTPQSCGFRDHYAELQALDTGVFGLSTQTTDYQEEARTRLNLPFSLLSDYAVQLRSALDLPTFSVDEMELYKRMTLIAVDSKIVKVFYPVFPPDRNVAEVLDWLTKN